MKFHRNRLVAWAREHNQSSLYDIGFSSLVQGDGQISLDMNGGTLSSEIHKEDMYRYKYLLVIDGNGTSGRLWGFLCSNSLVFLVEGMSEWFYDRLTPWVHYVPVSLDLSDLEARVQWAIDHDGEAQAIVKRANKVMSEQTRGEDTECYWYRFLLEYGALWQHNP